jgi:phosphatidylglycerophosphate synthase
LLWLHWQLMGAVWAIPVLLAIIASDFADGIIARRLGIASVQGAVVDVACDSIVIISACLAMGLHDSRYLILLGFVGASLFSWVGFSLLSHRLMYSRVGKLNGGVCYIAILLGTAAPLLLPANSNLGWAAETAAVVLAIGCLSASAITNISGIWKVRRRNCRAVVYTSLTLESAKGGEYVATRGATQRADAQRDPGKAHQRGVEGVR